MLREKGASIGLPRDFLVYDSDDQISVVKECLRELSLDEKRQPCYDQTNQESNVHGVYLAGVVCGGLNTREFFIENSIVHAEQIVKDIVGKEG